MLRPCYRLNDVFSSHLYDEALIPNVTELEDRPFKEINKMERGEKCRILIWKD